MTESTPIDSDNPQRAAARSLVLAAPRLRRSTARRNMLIVFEDRDAVGLGIEDAFREGVRVGRGQAGAHVVAKELEQRVKDQDASQWLPDNEIWRFDFGPEDPNFGCAYLAGQAPERFKQTATNDLRGHQLQGTWPRPCFACFQISGECEWARTLNSRRIVSTYPHRGVFDPFVTVLWDGAPSSSAAWVAVGSSEAGQLFGALDRVLSGSTAEERLPQARQIVENILSESIVEFAEVHQLLQVVRTPRRPHGMPNDGTVSAAGAGGHGLLISLLEQGYVEAAAGQLLRNNGRIEKHRLVVPRPDGETARLHGHFVVFPNNADDWLGSLVPFGAEVISWKDIASHIPVPVQKSLRSAERRTEFEDVVAAARTVLSQGETLTWGSVGVLLGVTEQHALTNLQKRCTRHGLTLDRLRAMAGSSDE